MYASYSHNVKKFILAPFGCSSIFILLFLSTSPSAHLFSFPMEFYFNQVQKIFLVMFQLPFSVALPAEGMHELPQLESYAKVVPVNNALICNLVGRCGTSYV